MKSFWGAFFGTMVGMVVTSVFILLLVVGIIAASVSQVSSKKEKTEKVKHNTVLHVKLNAEIPERSGASPFGGFSFSGGIEKAPLGLNDILANIEKAKDDKNISGIYLDIAGIPAGIATLEEIRNALLDFKSSGKFILAYSEGYAQGAYYLATAADKIYLNPEGMVEFKGLSQQVTFFKNMLEKLEIEMQIFRHGKYKSAIEPFYLEKMSEASREQVSTYVNSIWNYMLEGIAKERKISIDDLNNIANGMLVTDGQSAVEHKLVDKTIYKDEMLDILAEKTEKKNPEKINYITMHKYVNAPESKKKKFSKDKVAIVYAQGSIEGGNGDDKTIGSERISKAIREARTDSTVKAIVLRVNSPGGSSLASDVIWREMVLAKKVKPVVVSMGDVAASGGYYIACAADAILAQPNTITGSIGVFGVFPNAKGLYENKFGWNTDTVNTNKHSDIFATYRPVSKEEGDIIQKWIEDVYMDFITKVGEGRGMETAMVDSIGQGRVWSGVDAKKIGLIDKFGGVNDALALAAEKAGLENYSLLELPKHKDPIEEMIENLSGMDAMVDKQLERELGSSYSNYRTLKNAMMYKGVQMRLPYEIVLY